MFEHLVPRSVFAHRGDSHVAPEETRAAYESAAKSGAEYLEADVRRSADGKLLLQHDDTFERTTDVAKVFPQRRKADASAFTWDELRTLDAGSRFNASHPKQAKAEYAREKLLLLEELIGIAEQSARGEHPLGLCLETKARDRYPGIEGDIVALMKERGWITQDGHATRPLVFQSFSKASLRAFARLAPHVPRLLLSGSMPIDRAIADALEVKASAIGPRLFRAGKGAVERAQRKGLAVVPYTVNGRFLARTLRYYGADGVFSDRAKAIKDVF